MKVHYYFKIFNNIKSEHEARDFAALELKGLFGYVRPIRNFSDELNKEPLSLFTDDGNRIQDIVIHELPYGKIHGYRGEKEAFENISHLAKRLAYIREIFLIGNLAGNPEDLRRKVFPDGSQGKNIQMFVKGDMILFRIITNQYFLEKSMYISKLSRNEDEIDRNVEILSEHLIKNIYRIPASSTLTIGKRLQDYFAIREEPSLYLNHYMHPYKGKFHPKMVRALLNYVYPLSHGTVLDNFAGSGTLLVEAGYLELDSLGVEINPLSVLMSNVKCHSLTIPLNELKAAIRGYLEDVRREIKRYDAYLKGQRFLTMEGIALDKIEMEIKEAINSMKKFNGFKDKETLIGKIIIAREAAEHYGDEKIKEFLLLSLSGAISDVLRRTKNNFEDVLESRINDLYLRIYLFHKLNEFLKIRVGDAESHVGDTRDMRMIESDSVNAIINSPPYSTALDYIKNDYPQLILLKLVESMERLELNMMGNPRINYNKKELLEMTRNEKNDPLRFSRKAHRYVDFLLANGRVDAGLRVYKFFIDMLVTLKEMYRVMKKGAKCAIIIGNNHYLINGKYIEIPNGEVILDLARSMGFKEDISIQRDLQKTSVGNIRKETVLILQK